MFQRVTILGNMGQDPEMRYMPDGTAVTGFSVATNSSRVDTESGERIKMTTWFRCSCWGKRGEAINEYFKKGKPILVEGRLKSDPQTGGPKMFQRQDGSMGATYELTVDNWSFAGSSDEESGGQNSSGFATGTKEAQEEDEIPF